jgi:hypothetical protein
LIYSIIVTVIAILSNGATYFFDYRERKSIAPKKRKLVQRLTNKNLEDIHNEGDFYKNMTESLIVDLNNQDEENHQMNEL